MAAGASNSRTTQTINDLYAAVLSQGKNDRQSVAVMTAMVNELDSLTKARRARLVFAKGVVPGVIWAALLVGAAATIGFTFFFGTHNVWAQVVMTGLLAVLVFVIMLVVTTVNRSFTGEVSVGPEALQSVLEEFGSED
jgi:hypothetical protein